MQDKEGTKNYAIGVDIGGTKMLAILFDCDRQEPVSDYKLATPRDNLEKFLVMLWALIDPLTERARGYLMAVGLESVEGETAAEDAADEAER